MAGILTAEYTPASIGTSISDKNIIDHRRHYYHPVYLGWWWGTGQRQRQTWGPFQLGIWVSPGSPAGGLCAGTPLFGRTAGCLCCCSGAECGAGWTPFRLEPGRYGAWALAFCNCKTSGEVNTQWSVFVSLTFLLGRDGEARHEVQALGAVHHQWAGAALWLGRAGRSAGTQTAGKTCRISVKHVYECTTMSE